MTTIPSKNFETFKAMLLGRTIVAIEETDHRTGAFQFTLDDGVIVDVDQSGDDMSYVDVSVKTLEGEFKIF
ncbi:hypothetical protein D3C71_448880 [compost metagenome]